MVHAHFSTNTNKVIMSKNILSKQKIEISFDEKTF